MGRRTWWSLVMAASLTAGLIVPEAAQAAPGRAHSSSSQVDSSFGQSGVATAFSDGSADALVAEPDGGAVVAGSSRSSSTDASAPTQVAVTKLLSSGQADTSFGTSGTVVTQVQGVAQAVAIAPDGGILVLAAQESVDSTTFQVSIQTVLLRLSPSGALDTTFGQAGSVALGSQAVVAPAGLAVVSSGTGTGEIYVGTDQAGTDTAAPTGVVYRLTPAGALDPAYGSGGGADIQFAPAGLALAPGLGDLLVGGASVSSQTGEPSGQVTALTGAGVPDPAFGGAGTVTINPPDADAVVLDLTLDGQGRIDLLVAPVNGDTDVARLLPSGQVDVSFGRQGFDSISLPALGLSSGDFLASTAAGGVVVSAVDSGGIVAARFAPDGTPDVAFGTDGLATAEWPEGGPALAPGAMTVAADGSILASGVGPGGDASGLTGTGYVARYLAADTGSSTQSNSVGRISGSTRIATAIAVSTALYATAPTGGAGLQSQGSSSSGLPYAGGVVLASAANYPDALVGVPLASAIGGPLLLTGGTSLEPTVAGEISRVLGSGQSGGTIDVLGGTAAISDQEVGQLTSAGYTVHRYAGSDRYQTATVVATQALDDPSVVLEATGNDFADAASAGAAAAHEGAAVLLTNGSAMPPEVNQYLTSHPSDQRYAIGGPAAQADPRATPVTGNDRYATSAAVAGRFFVTPAFVALATGLNFPDALVGGAFSAALGGPLLLTQPTGLPTPVQDWAHQLAPWLNTASIIGGTAAVNGAVAAEMASAMT
jgi:uncharacterized delta-60 repeat protein